MRRVYTVSGKLLAIVALVGLILISVLPLVALSFLFGGVGVTELLAGIAGLFATTILFSAIGIFNSALMQTVPKATMGSLSLTVLWMVFIPALIFLGGTLLDTNREFWQQHQDILFSPQVVYGVLFLLCCHPFIALGTTALSLMEGENLFWITFTLPDNHGDIIIPSPWWVYCIFALIFALAFLFMGARRVKPIGYNDTQGIYKHRRANTPSTRRVTPIMHITRTLNFIGQIRRLWSAEIMLLLLLTLIMTPIYMTKVYIDRQWVREDQVQQHMRQGEALAIEGDIEGATEEFTLALALNPDLPIQSPEEQASSIAARPFINQGYELARAGDMEAAIEQFTKARELYPTSMPFPEAEARKTIAQTTIVNAERFAEEGKIEHAVHDFSEAQVISATIEIDAESWHKLCWWGSVWNAAPLVMEACDQAVLQSPIDANIRYSRGIARAVTGDYEGAHDDLHFHVRSREQGWLPQSIAEPVTLEEEMAWILALQDGRNPFDEQTLERLRGMAIASPR